MTTALVTHRPAVTSVVRLERARRETAACYPRRRRSPSDVSKPRREEQSASGDGRSAAAERARATRQSGGSSFRRGSHGTTTTSRRLIDAPTPKNTRSLSRLSCFAPRAVIALHARRVSRDGASALSSRSSVAARAYPIPLRAEARRPFTTGWGGTRRPSRRRSAPGARSSRARWSRR